MYNFLFLMNKMMFTYVHYEGVLFAYKADYFTLMHSKISMTIAILGGSAKFEYGSDSN